MTIKQLFNLVSPPFTESSGEKPKDNLFTAAQRPPPTVIIVAARHAIIILALMVFPVIVGKEIGLSDIEMGGFISLQILLLGIITFEEVSRKR